VIYKPSGKQTFGQWNHLVNVGHGTGEHGTKFTAVIVILLYAETTDFGQALECGDTVFWADEILCAGFSDKCNTQ
jgi:hypothetical protein